MDKSNFERQVKMQFRVWRDRFKMQNSGDGGRHEKKPLIPAWMQNSEQGLLFGFCEGAGSCSMRCVMSQTHPLTTTGFELPGYRITKSFGVVRGIIVRSRSVVGNVGASIQAIFGGNITLYTNLCEQAREDTFNMMLTHAGELGANAVIGVRYDATEIAPGITEVLCYGTAVFVEKAA